MATRNHISFLEQNRESIKEPIIIVGSKHYDFDKESIKVRLNEWGFKDITGIDLIKGEGVDHATDITDSGTEFLVKHENHFSTLICMEVLTHVKNPFAAARNMISLLKKDGIAILSECYVRKISKMPVDLWRFTYDGTKELFSDLKFDDSKVMISLTREKDKSLLPLKYPLPQVLLEKNADESSLGFLARRIQRKFFASGIFRLSRLLPETTIYSIAKKSDH